VFSDFVNVLFENDESESLFFKSISSVKFMLEAFELNFILIKFNWVLFNWGGLWDEEDTQDSSHG
jgi:hypothetical protein